MPLHNRISHQELKERLLQENAPRTTFSFYKYTSIEDPESFRDQLFAGLEVLGVFGRIYVAPEGINAQASVFKERMEACKAFLYSFPFLDGVRINIALEEGGPSFWVLKVKVRDKIVADGISDKDFQVGRKGKYLDAQQFNRLTEDPSTLVVDMRNHYEFEVGHFDKAIALASDTFREQLPMVIDLLKDQKEKPVVMYCTGGIRCEKASAYLLHKGFRQVYHLEGGIIEYARQVREQGLPNKFLGKNFVFDGRLGERITGDILSRCHQCGCPCDTHTNCRNAACHVLFIQCESCAEKFSGCCSPACQQVNALPMDEQRKLRRNREKGTTPLHKSRHRLRPFGGDLFSAGKP